MPVPVIVAALGAGAIIYQTETQKKEASKQRKSQRSAQASAQKFETMAGEHWEELNKEQMELQSQQQQIMLLSDIIKKEQEPAPQVVTLPPAKTYSPIDRINIEIGKMFVR